MSAFWFWEPMSAGDWVWMSILWHHRGGGGHWLLIKVYELAEASAVQPFAYLQLVFAATLGITVFGETLEWNVALRRWAGRGGGDLHPPARPREGEVGGLGAKGLAKTLFQPFCKRLARALQGSGAASCKTLPGTGLISWACRRNRQRRMRIGIAVGIVELTLSQHPPEGHEPDKPQKEADRDQEAENIHEALTSNAGRSPTP